MNDSARRRVMGVNKVRTGIFSEVGIGPGLLVLLCLLYLRLSVHFLRRMFSIYVTAPAWTEKNLVAILIDSAASNGAAHRELW